MDIRDPGPWLNPYYNEEEDVVDGDLQADLEDTPDEEQEDPDDKHIRLSTPLAAAKAELNALRDERDLEAVYYADMSPHSWRVAEEERILRELNEAREAERRARAEKEERELAERPARLKREEEELTRNLRMRELRLREKTDQQISERIRQLAREQEEEVAIARLLEEMKARREMLRVMRVEREAQEQDLKKEEAELAQVRLLAAAKKEERIKATKEYDDHPTSLSARYSRACTICLSANPRRRATLIACGHMMCVSCAEMMSEGPGSSGGKFACPYCRKTTGFIPTFEDPDEPTPRHPSVDSAESSRKRPSDDSESSIPSSSKIPCMFENPFTPRC